MSDTVETAVTPTPAPSVVAEVLSHFLAWMDTGNREAVSRWDAEIIYAHVAALTTQLESAQARERRYRAEVDENMRVLQAGFQKFTREASRADTAEAREKALREACEQAHGIFLNCEVTSGTCCCGDDMQRHSDPMVCGHSPVDQGHHAVSKWLENYATLAQPADGGK